MIWRDWSWLLLYAHRHRLKYVVVKKVLWTRTLIAIITLRKKNLQNMLYILNYRSIFICILQWWIIRTIISIYSNWKITLNWKLLLIVFLTSYNWNWLYMSFSKQFFCLLRISYFKNVRFIYFKWKRYKTWNNRYMIWSSRCGIEKMISNFMKNW